MNKQLKGVSDASNCEIYQIMARVYTKQRDYDSSLKLLQKMMELSQENYGEESEQVGNVFLQMAKIHARRRDVAMAIGDQSKAQQVYEKQEKYQGTDFIAGIATQLSTWQEQTGLIDESLVNLNKALEIYEGAYGLEDVRTCKIKRNVALVYLRGNKFEDALKELKEVESLERILYGDTSSNVAKTQKVIGTLMIIMNNTPDQKLVSTEDAREYLMQAHSIFEQRGMLKQLRETKQKLKLLHQTNKQAALAVVQNELNEIAQSEREELDANDGGSVEEAQPGGSATVDSNEEGGA